MTLLERLNLEDEFKVFKLEGLSVLERKLLVDLIRRKHPSFWDTFKSNAYVWNAAKENLKRFIKLHHSEFTRELREAGFNGNGFSKAVNGEDDAHV